MGDRPSSDDLALREAQVRDEIRQLQEERARAMLEEIDVLQKEKRLSLAKLKTLQTEVVDLRKENDLLKSFRSDAGVLAKLARLELQNEQELEAKRELKDKLKLATQHNARLMLKLKKLEQSGAGSAKRGVTSPAEAVTTEKPNTTDAIVQASFPRDNDMENKRESRGVQAERSPTLQIRYKVPDSIRDALAEARQTIGELRQKVEDCEQELEVSGVKRTEAEEFYAESLVIAQAKEELVEKEKSKRRAMKSSYRELKNKLKALQLDSTEFRSELSELRSWSKRRLKAVSEDMEICRAIYSLKNSLSQEQSALEEMALKMKKHQQEVSKANAENERLAIQVRQLVRDKEESRQKAASLSEQLHTALKSKDAALLLLNQVQQERQATLALLDSNESLTSSHDES